MAFFHLRVHSLWFFKYRATITVLKHICFLSMPLTTATFCHSEITFDQINMKIGNISTKIV